jgi:twinkle protein
MEDSTYMYKTRCDNCGSSDANAVYSNGNTHCFSCGKTVRGENDTFEQSGQIMKKEFNPSFLEYPNQIRGISKITLEKFTYGVTNGKHCTYYYNTEGDIVAEKYRTKDKDFSWSGSAKEATLFGQNVWKPSDRIKLIVTEGEIDCLSVSEIQGNKYPVVSLPNGAASAKKDVKANYEYLSSFKELVLMFDNDEVGMKAAQEVQLMFPPKYCKIAKLPLKDANEMLRNGKSKELVSAIFQAETHTPEEIKSGGKLLELLDKVDKTEHHDFPKYLPNLTKNMRGMRIGDLTIVTAASGAGKTTLMKQLELHFNDTTDFNQGIIHLEEGIRDTLEGLVSVKLGRQLHLEDDSNQDPIVRDAWEELVTAVDSEGNSKLSIVDTFGALDTEKLYGMIRYLAQVENCKVVYLDHITMLVSGLDGQLDDRKALDLIMTSLKSLTQELNIHLFVVSHLNNSTNGGKAFEEGGTANVNNLRGSGSLKQLADNVILLTRNQMAETPKERSEVQVSLLKCRKTGQTGHCDKIYYDNDTGIFTEVEEEHIYQEENLAF